METLIDLLEAMSFWGWMAVIAVGAIAIEGLVTVKRMQIKHSERMAKIGQGIDPGNEIDAYEGDEV